MQNLMFQIPKGEVLTLSIDGSIISLRTENRSYKEIQQVTSLTKAKNGRRKGKKRGRRKKIEEI